MLMPLPRPTPAPRRQAAARPAIRWVALATLLTASIWGGPRAHGQALEGNPLPSLGDSVSQELSPTAERRLGDRIMRSLKRDPDVIDDPLIQAYIEQQWRGLLVAARLRGEIGPDLDAAHAWSSFLVRDRSVNAFALPGGYIGIHLGLIAMTNTADELASVLAHELSHVTQRHIARMIGQQSRTSWVSIATMIAGILAASRNAQAAQALIYGGQAVSTQTQLNFSRDMEREADRVGFGVLAQAGYDTAGMASMFEMLQQASRLNDDGRYPYLRTHPLTSERIGDARARLGLGGDHAIPPASRPDGERAALHAMMAARSRVLMDTRTVALQALMQQEPASQATALQRVARHYTVMLAAQRGGAPTQAAASLVRARDAARELPFAQQAVVARVLDLGEAENHLLNRQPAAASAALQRALASGASLDGRPELLLATQVTLASPDSPARREQAVRLAERLQAQVSRQPDDATSWTLLASLWSELDQPLRAVRAEAEAVAALGDLPGAIERIQGARARFRQPDAAGVIELSVMDARMKAWMRQQRDDLQDAN
ncbi:M48 family metalloprotease [uncultured Aquabacterium sp.]|uniref:M48 family metalloprotease n=1 Tax=Aquabacterium sp. TaxID=1872578 RepID=UPI0025DA921D|nr:M48 family metalloprotease [uncultured Aquabacterium sp.]